MNLQFSLKAVVSLTVLTSVCVSYFAFKSHRARGRFHVVNRLGGNGDVNEDGTLSVSFSRTVVTGAHIRAVQQLDQKTAPVTALSLHQSRIERDVLDSIRGCKSLKSLDLSSASLSDDDLSSLREMKKLTRLNLGCNQRLTVEGIRNVRSLIQLRFLSLSFCDVDDECVPLLTSLPNLEELNVTGTRISDSGLKRLQTEASIKTIYAVTESGDVLAPVAGPS